VNLTPFLSRPRFCPSAELIVTGDKGLLSVGEHRGVRILGVSQALTAIEQARK